MSEAEPNVVYPYMPAGARFEFVDMHNPFMVEGFRAGKELSTEHNHPTGSVIVKDGKILGRAGNQAAFRNATLVSFHKRIFCVRRFFKVKTGQKYWICPGCASFQRHSEQQAIKDAQRNGNETTGADLYLWGHWWCCEPCWQAMTQAGIRQVYLLKRSHELFNKAHPANIVGRQ